MGCHLDYDALGGTQADAFWRVAGQQQTGRPRRPQRCAGAGGVAAAQQFLPAADVMLKFWFGLFAKQGSVLLVRKVEQAADIFPCKRLFGRKHAGNALWRDADDRVGQLLGQFQLMQGHDDGHILLVGQRLQNSHQLSLAFYIQKRRRLVQQQDLRLLADRPGQQYALALTVADFCEIPRGQFVCLHQMQGVTHLLLILIREDAQSPGVGVAAGGGHVKAGGQLGAGRVGQHQCQLAGACVGGVGGQRFSVQQYRAALGRQLPGQRF